MTTYDSRGREVFSVHPDIKSSRAVLRPTDPPREPAGRSATVTPPTKRVRESS